MNGLKLGKTSFNFKSIRKPIKIVLAIVFVAVTTLGLSISLQSLLADWQNPACDPPGCNVPAPINIGSSTAPTSLTQGIWSNLNIGDPAIKVLQAVPLGGVGVTGEFIVNTDLIYASSTARLVGIGTASPLKRFHVSEAGSLTALFQDTTSNASAVRLSVGTISGNIADRADWLLQAIGADGRFRVYHQKAPTGEALTILENGNVGIASSAPTDRLSVEGNIRIGGAGNGLIFPDGSKQTMTAVSLKQIAEDRTRTLTNNSDCTQVPMHPTNACRTAANACGQPYRCTKADALSGRSCEDRWGQVGWLAIDNVNCSKKFLEWADPAVTTPWTCTASGPQGLYNSCVGF